MPAVGKTARRAARVRPPQRGSLVERSRSDKVPALAFGDGGAEGVEGISVKGRHHAQIRVDGNHGGFLSAQAAIQPGMSPNIGPDGHLGKSMFGRTMVASSGRMRTLYPHASMLSDVQIKLLVIQIPLRRYMGLKAPPGCFTLLDVMEEASLLEPASSRSA